MRKLFLFAVFWTLPALSTPLKICYVSSPIGPILPRMTDLPKQHAGFRQAVIDFNKRTSLRAEFKVSPFASDPTPIASGLAWADREGCHAVVGLVSSRDALLAAPELKSRGMIGFSSTATSSELDRFFPSVMSAATSVKSWVDAMSHHVETSPSERAIALHRPDDIYSLAFTERLTRKLGSRLEVWKLQPDNHVSEAQVASLKPEAATSFLFTTYPILSIPTLNQISSKSDEKAKANWKVFGTQSWMEIQAFRARPDLMELLPPLFVFTPWDHRSPAPKYGEFKSRYQKAWNASPDHDSVYDYDTVGMILSCFAQNPKVQDRRKMIQACLSKKFEYQGMTGKYVYDGFHAHPQRQEILISYDLNGMIP